MCVCIYIYVYKYIYTLKVRVKFVHYTGRQGSNMRPPRKCFSEFESIFFRAKDLTKYFNMRPARKDKRGVRESIFFIREEWPRAATGI